MIQPSSSKIAEDEVEGTDNVPGPSVPRKSTRTRKAQCLLDRFQLYLLKEQGDRYFYLTGNCFHYSRRITRPLVKQWLLGMLLFGKKHNQSEIDSIMHNDT
ncbi:hypothetical protein Tco_1568710 [Tanacetum coccineum]